MVDEDFLFILSPKDDPCAVLALRTYIIAARSIGEHEIADDLERLMKENGIE